MRSRDFRTVSVLAALTLLGYSACAAGSGNHDPYPGPSAGGTGGKGGSKGAGEAGAPEDTAGSGGERDTPPDPGIDLGGAPPASMGGGDGMETCAATVSKAELLPLDLYVMLDSSGSMSEDAPEGGTKWDAVKGALEAFISDESSSDIGVGLQYFPVDHPDVPEECTSNEQCGLAGECALKWCWNYPQAVPCEKDADCGTLYGPCVEVAQCSESGQDCYPSGATCSGQAGTCTAWGGPSFCLHPSSCAVSAYATPDVAIAPLPDNASALLESLAEELPDGAYTTTGPAVRGAIQHAVDYAEEHPGHTVAVVLATDGLPSAECEPDDIPSIATIVTQGRISKPSVRTFVIGIFGQGDEGAFENLTALATAGGHTAFLVDSDADDVTATFAEALTEIRGAALACEFKLPTAEDGESLDYEFVNVTVSNGDESLRLGYVGNEDDCDDEGGWYYDVNPAAGIPTRIILCPASCESLQGSAENSVSIEVGCATVVK